MPLIPTPIPASSPLTAGSSSTSDNSAFFTWDVAIGGLPFNLASTKNDPLIRETAPFHADRLDQAAEAGEQTLSSWWFRAQSSFHGGAGQLNYESPLADPRVSHIRFDQSKNVDVFTPGKVTRLPDTAVVTTDAVVDMCAYQFTDDFVLYCTTGASPNLKRVNTRTNLVETYTNVTEQIISVATDDAFLYGASSTGIWKVLASTPTAAAVKIASFASSPTARVAVCKGRLLVGAGPIIYEVDSNSGTTVALGAGQQKMKWPMAGGFNWRTFAETPKGIAAAGDAGGRSWIISMDLSTTDGSTPTLTAGPVIATMPVGERVLAMAAVQGTFLAIGTTRGIRVGSFNSAFGYLTLGPLLISTLDPAMQCAGVTTRDRFVYAAGKAYDEPGLTAIDLGQDNDGQQGLGHLAYSSHLICPSNTGNADATRVVTLHLNNTLAFYVPNVGICVEQAGAGTGRTAWIRTSRIRYNTTEPKFFKRGRVRGDLANGSVQVSCITTTATTVVATPGFTTMEPDEFRLVAGAQEWMQYQLQLTGAPVALRSWQMKSLPGTPRQRQIQVVLQCWDFEYNRQGRAIPTNLTARSRLQSLEALDANGDETTLEEYHPSGIVRTAVVIDKVSFKGLDPPTDKSGMGGLITVQMRTLDA